MPHANGVGLMKRKCLLFHLHLAFHFNFNVRNKCRRLRCLLLFARLLKLNPWPSSLFPFFILLFIRVFIRVSRSRRKHITLFTAVGQGFVLANICCFIWSLSPNCFYKRRQNTRVLCVKKRLLAFSKWLDCNCVMSDESLAHISNLT